MIDAVYRGSWDRARLATLASLVCDAADAGDAAASEIVAQQAHLLAATAIAAARKVDLPMVQLPLALTGGPILNGQNYRELFLLALRNQGLQPEPVVLVQEPVEGALRMARSLAEIKP